MADGTPGVASSNTVGYDERTSEAGFNWIGPEFRTIGYNTVNIHNISLSGDNVDPNGGDTIQFLNANGNTVESYDWLKKEDSGEATDGWFDQGEWEKPTKSISGGDGVMVSTRAANVTIKVVGEVNTNGYTRTSLAGFNWIGNVFPVGMDIHAIKLSGDNVDPNGGDTIQFLNANGNTVESYDWLKKEDSGETTDGWFDQGEWEKPTRTILAGDGVMISTRAAGVTITVPGITLPNN